MESNNQPVSNSGFFLERLMDNLTDAIYFKDLESRFVMLNKACLTKHGWESLAAVAGKTDFDVFSREHAEQAFADEQRIIETGEPLYGIEEKETWPDGSVTWVSTTKMPLKNSAGKIIGTFGISRDITERKESEFRAQKYADEIRLIKEEMEEDVRMAGELQKTFFSGNYPVYPARAAPEDRCVEFLHEFKACSDVSGDYCSIQRLSDTMAGIFLCDVRGIGVRAALGTALIRGIIQEIASLGMDPGAYLTRMNQLLSPLLCQEGVPLDVKACYFVIDLTSGKIQLANAGHSQPILVRSSGEARRLSENSEKVGPALAMNADAVYEASEHVIEPGDRVVLFTDGLCSVANSAGQFYSEEDLLSSVGNHVEESMSEFFASLEKDARSFAASHTFSDDICLVGLQLNRFVR